MLKFLPSYFHLMKSGHYFQKSYLDNVTIVQLCDSHLIQTCGIIIFDTFTSNNQSDLSLIQSTVASMLPNYKIDPALTPHSQNIVVISNLLPWQLTKPLLYADESDEIPMAFNERRLKKRKSHPDYENLLDLETFCLDSRRELKKVTVLIAILQLNFSDCR